MDQGSKVEILINASPRFSFSRQSATQSRQHRTFVTEPFRETGQDHPRSLNRNGPAAFSSLSSKLIDVF